MPFFCLILRVKEVLHDQQTYWFPCALVSFTHVNAHDRFAGNHAAIPVSLWMTCWHHVGQVIPAPSRWTGWMFQGTNSRSLSSAWWDFCAQRSSSIVQTGFPIYQLLVHQKNRQIISVIFTFGDDVYMLLTGLSHRKNLVTSLYVSALLSHH